MSTIIKDHYEGEIVNLRNQLASKWAERSDYYDVNEHRTFRNKVRWLIGQIRDLQSLLYVEEPVAEGESRYGVVGTKWGWL